MNLIWALVLYYVAFASILLSGQQHGTSRIILFVSIGGLGFIWIHFLYKVIALKSLVGIWAWGYIAGGKKARIKFGNAYRAAVYDLRAKTFPIDLSIGKPQMVSEHDIDRLRFMQKFRYFFLIHNLKVFESDAH